MLQGDTVTFTVATDIDASVLLEGYELQAEVPAGGIDEISFVAVLLGAFLLEETSFGIELAELEVSER